MRFMSLQGVALRLIISHNRPIHVKCVQFAENFLKLIFVYENIYPSNVKITGDKTLFERMIVQLCPR